MKIAEARATAHRWVESNASPATGFGGAYLAGSVNWLPDDGDMPATSDVDVTVVTAGAAARVPTGKVTADGLLLDVAQLPRDAFADAETVLGHYQLGPPLSRNSIIADPLDFLTPLHRAVKAGFTRREWVERRCEDASAKVMRYLASVGDRREVHDQAMSVLFAAGITTHVLLTAGLRNPTVRRRYADVRDVLAEHGSLDFHERLLGTLGSVRLTPERARSHLAAMTEMFDAAVAASRTHFFFSSDISDAARPIAVDGGREMVDAGLHREAMFWIAVTQSRCQKILAADAPADVCARFAAPYAELLADLGIGTRAAIAGRAAAVEESLPGIRSIAESMISQNTAIRP